MRKSKKDSQRITKVKPFLNKYNWKKINSPSETDDSKKNEENSWTIALHVLYVEEEKIYPAYASKHQSNRENQVIPLMIPNGEGWHFLAVKNYQHY